LSVNLSNLVTFRTYPHGGLRRNLSIIDAICATIAIPSFFSPVIIGDDITGQSFVGGAVVATNPTSKLVIEAGITFQKDISTFQVLSLGHGTPKVLSVDELTTTQGFNRPLEDSEVEFRARVDEYLRLGVISGMEDVSMDKWGVLGVIRSHTDVYLETFDVREKLDGFLRRLYKTNDITLEKIGGLTRT
jgi:predicted acylesterase/phospholipase RssA